MAKRNPTSGETSKTRVTKSDASEEPNRVDHEGLLVTVLDCIVNQFIERSGESGESASPSISDLVRIVQLRRELVLEEPIREVEVRWVES